VWDGPPTWITFEPRGVAPYTANCLRASRLKSNFLSRIKLFYLVQSIEKIFWFPKPNHFYNSASTHSRASRDRHGRGVDAMDGSGASDESACCGRQIVWSERLEPASSCGKQFRKTVGQESPIPESSHSRKTIAQEGRTASLTCMLVGLFCTFCTRDGDARAPGFPCASFRRWRQETGKPRRDASRNYMCGPSSCEPTGRANARR